MKITQHQEGYNVSLEAGEEITVTIGGATVTWTVQANNTGQFSCKFNEERIKEEVTE